MVNIHVFDLTETELETPRAKQCLNKTLTHQTNYKLYIWHLNSPEIQEIIAQSKFCQFILQTGKSWSSLFQYLKMPILSKYGGFCFELDCFVNINLDELPIDRTQAYLPIIYNQFPSVCAWEPIYIPKGFNLSKSLAHADLECSSDESPWFDETNVCRVFNTENVQENKFIKGTTSHYQAPIFNFAGGPSLHRFQFNNNKVIVEVVDFFKNIHPGVNKRFELLDKDIFLTCCEQFETFKIIETLPTEIEMTQSFYDWISQFIKVPDKVKIYSDAP